MERSWGSKMREAGGGGRSLRERRRVFEEGIGEGYEGEWDRKRKQGKE